MEMTTKPHIIYIKQTDSSFIRGDQQLLEKHFEVEPFLMKQNSSKLVFAWRMVTLFFYLLSKVSSRNVMFVCWFADYHAAVMTLVAKMTGKKSVILIGGQEAVCYFELKKGVYRKKFRGDCVRFALRNTDLIIANHKSLIYHENYYFNAENPHIDGIQHYVKDLTTRTEIVFNGINPDRIVRDTNIAKQDNLILTVGTMNQIGDFYNKGYDLFIETAKLCPDLKFVMIGLNPNYVEWTEREYAYSQIQNLTVIPSFCPQDLLNINYNKAKVFIQASITEGMPNTLGESMLMGCVPVGSNVNGIPDCIGDTGIILKQRKAEELEKCIRQALKLNTGEAARQRIIELFSFKEREEKLVSLIKSV